ncbi:cytochrome c oxidase subunit 6C-like [Copidosoma floridanum]|uniref:cytochrome c oxidase subunit 6C-like n=1 Tax=Copidosoma floridanum TaxID=29053 RepID=UPI0006C99B48|nr:cytochrome c oxidase subunit 6C-like [Copidosoma floridanum]
MSCIPKPKMRGLHLASCRRHIILAVITSACSGLLWKLFVADPRKKAYRDYYLDYDAEFSAEYMSEYLQSGNHNGDH